MAAHMLSLLVFLLLVTYSCSGIRRPKRGAHFFRDHPDHVVVPRPLILSVVRAGALRVIHSDRDQPRERDSGCADDEIARGGAR